MVKSFVTISVLLGTMTIAEAVQVNKLSDQKQAPSVSLL